MVGELPINNSGDNPIDMARIAEAFAGARLVASDYDETMVRTVSEPPPSGIDVPIAYELAINHLFGSDGLDRYNQAGGFQYQSPIEIAIAAALPGIPADELDEVGKELDQRKVEILVAQIGTRLPDDVPWPRPVNGFPDSWQKLTDIRAEGGLLNTAVISSGHTAFISKTFEMLELEPPDIMVSTEELGRAAVPEPMKDRVKPSPLSIYIAVVDWQALYGIQSLVQDRIEPSVLSRIVYIGEDVERDAGMAANAGVAFEWVSTRAPEAAWQRVAARAIRETTVQVIHSPRAAASE